MRENTPLDNFLGFMKLQGSANSVSAQQTQSENAQDNEMQSAQAQSATAQDSQMQDLQGTQAQDFIIANDDELKQCLCAFGAPSDLLSAKEF